MTSTIKKVIDAPPTQNTAPKGSQKTWPTKRQPRRAACPRPHARRPPTTRARRRRRSPILRASHSSSRPKRLTRPRTSRRRLRCTRRQRRSARTRRWMRCPRRKSPRGPICMLRRPTLPLNWPPTMRPPLRPRRSRGCTCPTRRRTCRRSRRARGWPRVATTPSTHRQSSRSTSKRRAARTGRASRPNRTATCTSGMLRR